ncbi:MAG: ATP-binding protein [Acetivibrio sp.]
MKKKLFLSYIFIILIALGISLTTFWSKGYSLISTQSEKYYVMQTKYLGDLFYYEAKEGHYEEFVEKYSRLNHVRITLIDEEGNVLHDSQKKGSFENHKDRKEVKEALAGGEGYAIRNSKTLGQMYCYSAIPVENEFFSGVLRVSVPMKEVMAMREYMIRTSILIAFFCLCLALGIAYVFSRKLIKPIENITEAAEKISHGDYDITIYTKEKDQIGRLAGSFNRMSGNLSETIEKLVKRNIELEAMLSSMQGAVVAIDQNNLILFFNTKFAEMNGEPDKEYIGCQLYDELQNETISECIAFAKNNEVNKVTEGMWKGYSIRTTATPLSDEHTILGVLVIIEDMTEIRRLENVRSDFVSNVTHELKTPLTSIRGFVDTLKNGAVQDANVAMRFLDIIDIETERLSSLIQDILLLSEIESKQDFDVESCNVNRVILEVKNLLESEFLGEVKFQMEVEPYIRPYPCNPGRLKELLINLIDNGCKYTEKGYVKLICKEKGNQLYIKVEDTGIGIEEEHLSRIFERFYRVDKSRSRKQGGTGLGLSIVKHIVELYNGKIKVDSVVLKGTTFEISLPYGESSRQFQETDFQSIW